MDWGGHGSASRSQLARATHANEFVPRGPQTSISPNLDDTSPRTVSPQNSSVADKVPYQENVGGTTYFYQYNSEEVQPTAQTSTVQSSTPQNSTNNEYPVASKNKPSFWVSDELRNDILNRNMLSLLQADPTQFPDLPLEVEHYHELFPLEALAGSPHKPHLGHQTSMYKATHSKTGLPYCLRRIHQFRLQNPKCMAYVELWKKLQHANIVQLKEVFTTKAFGDSSMVFVYDYHPGSETLLNKHFNAEQGAQDPFSDSGAPRPYSYQKNNLLRHQHSHKLPEPLIWNYIVQLTSALRLIHASQLACRSLDPTKIILTDRARLRLSCLGTLDVVLSEAPALVPHHQQEDLTALGKLVLALACKSTMAVQRENISTALDVVGRCYTADLRNLIVYLLTAQQRRSVSDLMPMIGARFYTQLDGLHRHSETLHSELSKEIQNGRLFRLLAKLATVNERSDLQLDQSWSETGDRYMLKLFRDYVFHQVTEDGQPWLDMAHIVQCLNKLDAAAQEKILLMSRDEQSVLLVSFAELKHCLDQSWAELIGQSTRH